MVKIICTNLLKCSMKQMFFNRIRKKKKNMSGYPDVLITGFVIINESVTDRFSYLEF